ncbi:MAG: hypothetical protein IPM69_19440 [Ignavibacteria bacterium]|nr:hypothetical protein [Ignavibacteria bacterium]
MEEFLCAEQSETIFTITKDSIYCDSGELEYSIENDNAIVNSISAYTKRNRIGINLVNQLERIAV